MRTVFLLSLAVSGCLPVRTGTDYSARTRVVDAVSGDPVEGARARVVGIQRGRPGAPVRVYSPNPCEQIRLLDSLAVTSSAAVGATVLSADTTAADGHFVVNTRRTRRWISPMRPTDTYWPGEYDWYRLEVEREGYATHRAVVTDECPGTLAAPEAVELVPQE